MIDLRCGDAREVLATLPDASVDAVVTDPPYALTQMSRGGSPRQNDPTKPYGRHRLADKGFMGQQWDNGRVAHDPAFWVEVLRVAKPGAFLLAFAGTRTYHRLACAIEDAGWECRDMIMWHYGSGFPKSKSCLKPSHEPIVLAKAPGPLQPLQIDACRVPTSGESLRGGETTNGHGSLTPGWDRPYKHDADHCATRAVAATQRAAHAERAGRWPPNTLFSHIGGPDGCRPVGVRRVLADKRGQGRPRGTFPHSDDAWGNGHRAYTGAETAGDGTEAQQEYVCVDGCPIKALDAQAGSCPSKAGGSSPRSGFWGQAGGCEGVRRDDTGGPSRFFPTFGPDPLDAVPFRYQPKASRRERNAGLDGLPESAKDNVYGDGLNSATKVRTSAQRARGVERGATANPHPTVKPTNLMAWLCKLVTPEGGVVLDCFAGSGSTGVACVREGFGFIGIEQDATYVAIMRARIAHEQERADGQLALPLGHACG